MKRRLFILFIFSLGVAMGWALFSPAKPAPPAAPDTEPKRRTGSTDKIRHVWKSDEPPVKAAG